MVQPSLEDIQQTERLAANGILSKGQCIDQIIELVEDARYRLTTLITPILAKTPVACRPATRSSESSPATCASPKAW